MKKLGVFAVLMAMGAGVAFAATISVPWFVDNAPEANKLPGVAQGTTGIVTLKNNTNATLTLTIRYFSQDGLDLGPEAPDNTFTIVANSSLAFRPVRTDPDAVTIDPRTGQLPTVGGGMEGGQGVLVPNRPLDQDDKFNGALTVSWTGDPTDIQGQVAYFQTVIDPARGGYVTLSYAHLLPPGI
jgi:hypothetical protein